MLSVAVQDALAATIVEQHISVLSAPGGFLHPALTEVLALGASSTAPGRIRIYVGSDGAVDTIYVFRWKIYHKYIRHSGREIVILKNRRTRAKLMQILKEN